MSTPVFNAPVLLLRAAACACAAPLERIGEVMRPLPVEPLAGAPAGVAGIAVIRGHPVPVVDLSVLLGAQATDTTPNTRFVTVRAGPRTVALRVEAVVAIRRLCAEEFEALPPLWAGDAASAVAALGVRDRQLLLVLEATRLAPEGAWEAAVANQSAPR